MTDLRLGAALWSIVAHPDTGEELKLEVGLRASIEDSLKIVRELGLKGVQLWAHEGALAADQLTGDARERFRAHIAELGLTVTGLETFAAPARFWAEGFAYEPARSESIDRFKTTIDLAVDLGAPSVSTHIGHVPKRVGSNEWQVVIESVREVAEYAERRGIDVAVETGFEPPTLLRRFIEEANVPSIKVNYDPANLVVGGFDCVEGVHVLGELIVHTHAKDAKRGIGEVPLGTGDVPWRDYLTVLQEVGYDGWHCIEVEHGDDLGRLFRDARDYLRAIRLPHEDRAAELRTQNQRRSGGQG